jgi:diguanylate cyclase (GGDEF)-like protein
MLSRYPSRAFFNRGALAMWMFRLLDKRPGYSLVSIGLLLAIGVSGISYLTGWEYTVMPLYLLPITMVSYHVGRWAGFAVAAVGTLGWALADHYSGIPYTVAAAPYWNALVRFLTFVVACFVLGHLKPMNRRLNLLASADGLTGLLNRRAFYDLAAVEMKRSGRYKRSFTVIYLDVDEFKAINDTLGHRVGDELLQAVAKTVRAISRASDYVARFGGDEFVILLPETPRDAAGQYLCKITQHLQEAMLAKDWAVTFSIGAVTFDTAPASFDDMIGQADGLMYAVKKTGKNRIKHEVYKQVAVHVIS